MADHKVCNVRIFTYVFKWQLYLEDSNSSPFNLDLFLQAFSVHNCDGRVFMHYKLLLLVCADTQFNLAELFGS